jgi:hypothetical protein
MHSLGELLDELGVESVKVIGFATGDEALVDVDFLVDPLGAGVAQVGLQAWPGGQRAAVNDPRVDQGPRRVADRADRLARLEEGADELDGVVSVRSWSGLATPPGSTRPS